MNLELSTDTPRTWTRETYARSRRLARLAHHLGATRPATQGRNHDMKLELLQPRPPEHMTTEPCPRCLELYRAHAIRREAVQPLPAGAMAPRADDRSGACCDDCNAADTLVRLGYVHGFAAARVCTANGRQEQLRLPGVPMGLVQERLMRANAAGDLERHHAWLDAHVDWNEGDGE